MRKVVSSKQILASTALAAALAVFGCTSNRIPGDGQPSSMPFHSPATAAPTNGTSGGARPGTSGGITPMISSGPASMTTPGVEAYAVVAQSQNFRGRILGPSSPGQSNLSEAIPPTGQFQNPALVANPEVTVNRSISSDATPAVINDSGAGITIVSGGGTTAASTVTGTTAAATVAGTATPSAASVTIAAPSQVVRGVPTPTQSAVGVPTPTMTVSPGTVAQRSATTPATTTATATAPATTKTRAIGNVTVPSVRLTTTSNGTPMITNAR